MNVLANGATRPVVRKKAALCLLRLLRKAPADAEIMQAEVWGVRLATMLEERDLGVLLGLTTLLLGLVSRSYEGGCGCCLPLRLRLCGRLVLVLGGQPLLMLLLGRRAAVAVRVGV